MTGTPPPDALTRAAAVVTHDPDPLEPAHHLNPGVPHDVSAILNQALALDPTARFANADAMRRALRQARGLSALPPVSDPTLVVGQLPAASQARPDQRSSAGTSTIPSGALRSPEPSRRLSCLIVGSDKNEGVGAFALRIAPGAIMEALNVQRSTFIPDRSG
jgi:hypothetical protein